MTMVEKTYRHKHAAIAAILIGSVGMLSASRAPATTSFLDEKWFEDVCEGYYVDKATAENKGTPEYDRKR